MTFDHKNYLGLMSEPENVDPLNTKEKAKANAFFL